MSEAEQFVAAEHQRKELIGKGRVAGRNGWELGGGRPGRVRLQPAQKEAAESNSRVILALYFNTNYHIWHFRLKDQDDLATEAENRHRFELQKQQRMLQTNLNIKRAMRKWISMDKESKQHQPDSNGRSAGGRVEIPEWAR